MTYKVDSRRLQDALLNSAMSIRDVSKTSGLAERTISKLTNKGGRAVNSATLGKLARALSVSPRALLQEGDNESDARRY